MKQWVCIFLVLWGTHLRAQNLLTTTMQDQLNTTGLILPANSSVWGLPSGNKGGVLGTPYLDTTWAKGNLKLYQSLQPVGGKPVDSLSGLALRYNVQFNEIEILLNTYKDTKALRGSQVRSFSLERNGKNMVFVNTGLYEGEKLAPGFFEINVGGRLTLATFHKIDVRKPTYNVAVDAGDKDTRLIAGEDRYVLHNGKAEKFKPTKKALLELMQDKSAEMAAYLKANDPDLKSETALASVFTYYNSL
jgi:hypothetical protein